jgi:hypothetical protein
MQKKLKKANKKVNQKNGLFQKRQKYFFILTNFLKIIL